MSNPRAAGSDGDEKGDREAAVAKTAGFLVFSGIALSILKSLNPLNKNRDQKTTQPLAESIQPTPTPTPAPAPTPTLVQQSTAKKPSICTEQTVQDSTSCRTIEIVRGDTLWGLSRKYGVSIDAIKEANGLSGDTIYAGKKLVIP